MFAVYHILSVHATAPPLSSADVAACIVRSTTTMGLAFKKTFHGYRPYTAISRGAFPASPEARTPWAAHRLGLSHWSAPYSYCPVVLRGGGRRRGILSGSDLVGARTEDGQALELEHQEYELIDYLPLRLIDIHSPQHRDCVVATVDEPLVWRKLSVPELKQLASHHGIKTQARDVRWQVLDMLDKHVCVEGCEVFFAALRPTLPSTRADSVEDQSFPLTLSPLSLEDMEQFAPGHELLTKGERFKIDAVFAERPLGPVEDGSVLVDNIPLRFVAKLATLPGLRSLAKHHGVRAPARWTKPKCLAALLDHQCHGCADLFYQISPVVPTKRPSRKSAPKGDWLDTSDEPYLWQSFLSISTEQYPPKPTSMRDIAVAMKGYCNELTPEAVEEEGCCVCGQLAKRRDMVLFQENAYDLSVLEEDSCTRLERTQGSDPVRSMDGPVMARDLSAVCAECDEQLGDGKRPKTALANHLWVGDVPDCLKDLTLGECALISRVRYNQCVVRVSQGHAKMIANVIAFEHPSKKIYERLPMGKDELTEVLSILYTGVSPPTDDDLRRTPVLVRRDKVRIALEWLKLNHKDYADLEIDYKTLQTYDLESVPIGLIRKEVIQSGGNVIAAAKSVFDNEFEQGTEEGMCPYAVTGLTAEQHGSLTTTQRKAIGLLNLKNGGNSLAVGHDMVPQSIWNNPGLYPQMFPWLFPYGHGGVGQDPHVSFFSRQSHIKWLLNYYDKRFQRDAGFLIVQMNHQLIRQSSKGSFISMKRGNFARAAKSIDSLDPGVILNIVERLKDGGRFIPQTPEERQAGVLMDQVDVVGSFVDGSLARRKYQRGEIWSLINYCNAPSWFLTVSPADSKHPLCVYWASQDIEFKPEIKGYKERQHLVTRNPVACAKFFHHIVQIFLKHICGWGEDGPKRGLFGVPEAYYGTVEEQGRKTLHLHFLLWICSQLPLNVVREKLMSDDSEFQRELTEYIESCMIGEFLTGSKDEVTARVPVTTESEDRGIHTILVDTSKTPDTYQDPTLTLPEAPPEVFCDTPDECICENCAELQSWWERFKATCDDILLRSNVHSCFARKDKKDRKDKDEPGQGAPKGQKTHATAKGCLNKKGVCTARFPREVFMHTTVDAKTGHLNVKKQESSINDVNPTVTVVHRCNTDCRCLLSGTSVKAVVGYVTDYISKAWLKTHQIFQTAYDAFTKNESILSTGKDDPERKHVDAARRMILKVVNSLSSKMEIGAPMAALYLLNNPDHYTSHEFVPFYWKNYVNYVHGQWEMLRGQEEPDENDVDERPNDVGVTRTQLGSQWSNTVAQVEDELGYGVQDLRDSSVTIKVEDHDDDIVVLEVDFFPQNRDGEHWDPEDVNIKEEDDAHLGRGDEHISDCDSELNAPLDSQQTLVSGDSDEQVRLTRTHGHYMAKSSTDDYRFRPDQLSDISLYDFVQCAVKHPLGSSRRPRSDLRWLQFPPEHAQHKTHAIALDAERTRRHVPNFIGPSLPRKDSGNRDDYCCAMLTLFCPWRTGLDLRSSTETWEERFNAYQFTERQKILMDNFNMRYECYDARDDYGSIIKAAGAKAENVPGYDDDESDDDEVYAENGENAEDDDEIVSGVGVYNTSLLKANAELLAALRKAGWTAVTRASSHLTNLPKIVLDSSLRSIAWNNIIKVEKMRAWRRRLSHMMSRDESVPRGDVTAVNNDAHVVPGAYLSKDFVVPVGGWTAVIDTVVAEFSLNDAQERAFRIVANHACITVPEQLLMHLGGMGGTGKSTVIKALAQFFKKRGEEYRLVLLGPTGTSAALIGGATYHTFLGVNTGWGNSNTAAKLEEVRERLIGVGYLFLDEVSMLNCRALCAISARCCEALGCFEKPFGGLSVILAGDFAQLPPVKGQTLYSRNVDMNQSARQKVWEQENTIGKHIWLQFTTVVMLTENMRQIVDDPKEAAFRKALENLRWRACTPVDIATIRSRIACPNSSLSVDAPGFKDVSVITALNRDKDQINKANGTRFAKENGEQLISFFATDELKSAEAKRRDPKKANRVYSTVTTMPKSMQVALWNQSPCTSEQIPGMLTLCMGMPVLIRYNEATELCITRGQEGRVVGWTAQNMPKWKGRQLLDTLYVELIDPPRMVNMPHLPRNVVPVTRNTETVEAQLPNDEWVCLARTQMPVLPNFAMTDYSSQGKTREWNVVDLKECKSFQAAYTCLSRGTSLAKTLIIRDFPTHLLTGELEGTLRQEYRELNYLNTITELRYRGVLPGGIVKTTRWDTIAAYRLWKEVTGQQYAEAPSLNEPDDMAPPRVKIDYKHETMISVEKRKISAEEWIQVAKKKRKTRDVVLANSAWNSPTGPVWDATDWSCAYDAWTFILHGLWMADRVKWTRVLDGYSEPMTKMLSEFSVMGAQDPQDELTRIRNAWRNVVRNTEGNEFARGRHGVDLFALTEALVGSNHCGGRTRVQCSACRVELTIDAHRPVSLSRFGVVRMGRSMQEFVDMCGEAIGECAHCDGSLVPVHVRSEIMSFEVVEAPDDLELSDRIDIAEWGSYRLAGVIYFGEDHFVSRVVMSDNKVYSHDGMHGCNSTFDGVLGMTISSKDMNTLWGKRRSLVVYALANRLTS